MRLGKVFVAVSPIKDKVISEVVSKMVLSSMMYLLTKDFLNEEFAWDKVVFDR